MDLRAFGNSAKFPVFSPMEHNPSKAKLSQEMTVTFQTSGLYGYRCLPHFGMGMVGLTEVGDISVLRPLGGLFAHR